MKVPTEPSISFDRISTREELEEVLDLLTDLYAPENGGISIIQEPADPSLTDWRVELERVASRVGNEDEEEPSQPHEKNLIALFLQMDKRTN